MICYGLEVRAPFAKALVCGLKTIDVRAYACPFQLFTRDDDDDAHATTTTTSATAEMMTASVKVFIIETSSSPSTTNAYEAVLGNERGVGALTPTVRDDGEDDNLTTVVVSGDANDSSVNRGMARIVGYVMFEETAKHVRYSNAEAFRADAAKHLVEEGSKYGYAGEELFGWTVKECKEEMGKWRLLSNKRLIRSVHQVTVQQLRV